VIPRAGRLPTAAQTAFLRACIRPGREGRQAFADWRSQVGDPLNGLRDAAAADRNLLPLLHDAGSVEGEGDLASVLRAAAVHEEFRSAGLQEAAAEVVGRLEAAGQRAVVLGGLALACSAYPAPRLRHCHDVDLLVEDVDAARAELDDLESVRADEPLALRHRSGTPVVLHRRLYRDRTRTPPQDLLARTISIVVGGRTLAALDPADQLALVCAYAPRPGLTWAADLWFLLRRELDWTRFSRHALAVRRAGRASILLAWAAQELAAEVPAELVGRLSRARRYELALDLIFGRARSVRNRVRAVNQSLAKRGAAE
jgi:hypothetical protein